MRVRRAEIGDAAAIALVVVESWRVAYRGLIPQDYLDQLDPQARREAWARGLAQAQWPRSGVLVAEAGDGVVGFVYIGPSPDEDRGPTTGALGAFYAVPAVWGTGVGRALMAEAMTRLSEAGFTEATLWVLDTNARARRFYEAAGWRLDGAVMIDESRGFPLSELRYRRSIPPPATDATP
jgi:GNAT superfamily N-acetyltransferase